jgi:hypothetical protein
MKKIIISLVAIMALLIPTATFAMPQFPNVYYGEAKIAGVAAPVGSVVTAVVDRGSVAERHYSLLVTPAGKYGSGNGLKLKVGGDLQGPIANNAVLEFFVTAEALPFDSTLTPAGVSKFKADFMPHVVRLNLDQN